MRWEHKFFLKLIIFFSLLSFSVITPSETFAQITTKSAPTKPSSSVQTKANPRNQAPAKPVQFRRAEAIRGEVEIFSESNFDSDILTTINPGKFYLISNRKYGAFYRIKISDKMVGFVADSEIDIEGVGRLPVKPFIDDPEPVDSAKNNKSRSFQEDEDEDESVFKNYYHGITVHLINYHEKTMGGLQVADLYAVGYRYIPFLSDFSSSISWDVNLAYGLPKYYTQRLDVEGQGITAWGGAQVVNISVIDRNKTLRYGLGPFLKYSNYDLKTNVKNYSLQELTFGLLLEGGFIFHNRWVSFDLGLRYYWERESYGGLSLGFLF